MGELTSENAAPYLITVTTLSVGASVIGEYFSNNASSSLSDHRRDSAYTMVVSRLRWGVANRQTAEFVENRICREKVCLPMTTTSAILLRYERPGWGSRLTWHHEFVRFGGPIHIEKSHKVDLFDNLFLLRPWQMIAPHLNLHADLGSRRNLSSYAEISVINFERKQRTYTRSVGVQIRASFVCNFLLSSPTNNLSIQPSFGTS